MVVVPVVLEEEEGCLEEGRDDVELDEAAGFLAIVGVVDVRALQELLVFPESN